MISAERLIAVGQATVGRRRAERRRGTNRSASDDTRRNRGRRADARKRNSDDDTAAAAAEGKQIEQRRGRSCSPRKRQATNMKAYPLANDGPKSTVD